MPRLEKRRFRSFKDFLEFFTEWTPSAQWGHREGFLFLLRRHGPKNERDFKPNFLYVWYRKMIFEVEIYSFQGALNRARSSPASKDLFQNYAAWRKDKRLGQGGCFLNPANLSTSVERPKHRETTCRKNQPSRKPPLGTNIFRILFLHVCTLKFLFDNPQMIFVSFIMLLVRGWFRSEAERAKWKVKSESEKWKVIWAGFWAGSRRADFLRGFSLFTHRIFTFAFHFSLFTFHFSPVWAPAKMLILSDFFNRLSETTPVGGLQTPPLQSGCWTISPQDRKAGCGRPLIYE